ncbi:hypothetical protein [Mycobacterium sp. NAZ190054]|uniref:hypothetical protein n=1 Tax=Mycobacterium sp. NAZ190054 TaxID=1747766 RepID=UPI0007938A19|nr:hypothetical protein [Mycobacterium sp. NAZ190054]KWX68895.1 hypothetical protein ASJ79_15855 [Mycobacterium sp. NAZ190054]
MSTLWLYVRIQAMMLVFGIVGPIFLFVYFAAQPDPGLRWMYWWGLFITAADVLVALNITDAMVARDRGFDEKPSVSSGSGED